MMPGKKKIGTIVSLNIPTVACSLFELGFDFLFIDLEHGRVDDATITAILQSRPAGAQVLIRIATIAEANIKHALELGADGIIAPRVERAEELETLVAYSYYPPEGRRSVGFCAANRFGLKFREYTEQFRPVLLPQVESVAGLSLLQQIADDPRFDGIFAGPYDLSASLGVAGQFESEIFRSTYGSIRAACKERNKLFGTFSANAMAARKELEQGADLVAIGVDGNLLLNGYQQLLEAVREQE